MSNLAAIQDAHIESEVVGAVSVPPATRLTVYPRAWRARLVEALEDNYPALAGMLGRTAFEALGSAYVDAHPSRFYSLRCYGDALPQFLASDPAYLDAPMLADLARWEWATTEVFDAAEAEPMGTDQLATVPPESWAELCFGLHPSVRTLELTWNAPEIWTALAGDVRLDAACDAERLWPAPARSDRPQSWLLWRRDLQIVFRPLLPFEAAALEHCRRGRRFGELCELARAWVSGPDAPQRMVTMLREWLTSGLIARAQLR